MRTRLPIPAETQRLALAPRLSKTYFRVSQSPRFSPVFGAALLPVLSPSFTPPRRRTPSASPWTFSQSRAAGLGPLLNTARAGFHQWALKTRIRPVSQCGLLACWGARHSVCWYKVWTTLTRWNNSVWHLRAICGARRETLKLSRPEANLLAHLSKRTDGIRARAELEIEVGHDRP